MSLVLAACASGGGGSGQWVELETEARDAPVIQLRGTVRHLDFEGGLRIRERPAGDSATAGLAGSKWRLEDLAGKGVVDRVEATLEFISDSAVSGNGSCNRFRGPVTVEGGTISFGPLAATRMFCGDPVTNQESEYFAALDAAERWEIKEPFLYIYLARRPDPLRFVREP